MKKFYDIHIHVLDLSHPNLTAFIFNDDLFKSLLDWKLRLILLIAPLFSVVSNKIIFRLIKKFCHNNPYIKNTLSFYDIPIEYQFLLLDYFLKHPDKEEDTIFNDNNHLIIAEENYEKIVFCPLTIDFGYKNIDEEGIFYNKAPYKPIAKQIGDLFYSIYTYYRFNLTSPEPNDANKLKLVEIKKDLETRKKEKLFEIYPFMGLNTQNYTLDELRGNKIYTGLLDKYFSEFNKKDTPQERQDKLYNKIGQFNGKMYEEDPEIYKNIFAGIKVYPQLGFDPFPKDPKEKAKVKFLYEYCLEKRIPLITHCSDGGFKVHDFDDQTSPSGKWKEVLEQFPELVLCFAHFGNQKNGRKDWEKEIIHLMETYKNVYTDISCNNCTAKFYNNLRSNMKNPEIAGKVLYGSDFSINMFASKIPSYNNYFKAFMKNTNGMREDLCANNPPKFLFGD